MDVILSWQTGYTGILMAIGLPTVSFIIYWFLSLAGSVRKRFEKKCGEEKAPIAWVIYQKHREL